MQLLVLGGTRFVGRAVVDEALGRGWDVTSLNRGVTARAGKGVHELIGDRTSADGIVALADRTFDAVVDTWSGAPKVVAASARQLSTRVDRYIYVSTRSVYAEPIPCRADESAAVVDANPDGDAVVYPIDKRGGELAAWREFGPERTTLLRCGLILGPHEDVGRLPWWLIRMARGGNVLAPGPPDLPLQYVDVRDLAAFVADSIEYSISGTYNVTSRRGHASMRRLLDSCVEVTATQANLVWVEPQAVLDAGIAPWVELPVWIPPGHEAEAMHDGNVERAHAAGLTCRPVEETVADTWQWVCDGGWSGPPVGRPIGLAPEREQQVLSMLRQQRSLRHRSRSDHRSP